MTDLKELNIELNPLPGAIPATFALVNDETLLTTCRTCQENGGRLVAIWATDACYQTSKVRFTLHVALAFSQGLVCLFHPILNNPPSCPDLGDIFLPARRMQRALFDMMGIHFTAHDKRPWLRHGAWPETLFPLRKDADQTLCYPNEHEPYPFIEVTGEGVHEIAVGPVHAGIIEPGHFRFQVVGEKILRLEERLGYTHKGIEKRFESMKWAEGVKLAGRISGDSAAAYSWAYAMAVESLYGHTAPIRSLWLRALALERERIANHLGDLGALGNDGGLAFGLSQFSRIKEDWIRTNDLIFGHRYLMDFIIPGGVTHDVTHLQTIQIQHEVQVIRKEVRNLKRIYDEHAGLQDRFLMTGRIPPKLATELGMIGLAGRSSGVAFDLRTQFPCAPYDTLNINMITHHNGDVAARVIVRFEEIFESLRLIELILAKLPLGGVQSDLPETSSNSIGLGWVEGWRGEIFFAIHTDNSK
ncbi:MAG: NADH-quinone oxidoreductase subunit C, partial [Pseudomonadota bacterium]|nr:NADH-quinone oxidoreductase subunit C [Pseudomonadota bacterium]